jgi:hypothetical protein
MCFKYEEKASLVLVVSYDSFSDQCSVKSKSVIAFSNQSFQW